MSIGLNFTHRIHLEKQTDKRQNCEDYVSKKQGTVCIGEANRQSEIGLSEIDLI